MDHRGRSSDGRPGLWGASPGVMSGGIAPEIIPPTKCYMALHTDPARLTWACQDS